MIRNIISVLLGLLVSVLVLCAVLFTGWSFFPLPEQVEYLIPSTYQFLDEKIYPGTYIFEIMAYAISAFFGGMTVAYFAKIAKTAYSTFIGIILFLFLLVKFFLIPHPGWFNMISLLPILPMGYFGGKSMEFFLDKKNHKNC